MALIQQKVYNQDKMTSKRVFFLRCKKASEETEEQVYVYF